MNLRFDKEKWNKGSTVQNVLRPKTAPTVNPHLKHINVVLISHPLTFSNKIYVFFVVRNDQSSIAPRVTVDSSCKLIHFEPISVLITSRLLYSQWLYSAIK